MRLVLSWVHPNTVRAKFEADFNTPDEHREYLKHIATKGHPIQLLFLEHLASRRSGLKLLFPSELVFEIECQECTMGEGAWVFYDSLGTFPESRRDDPELDSMHVHNMIHKVDVNFRPKDLVTFWLGNVDAEGRRDVKDYLGRLGVR